MIALLIFDVDGTLVEKYSLNLLPQVGDFFHLVFRAGCPQAPLVALASNQGGVGMRHWMETGGFGKPEKYPTADRVETRLSQLVNLLGEGMSLPVYISYRYLDRRGRWSPVPAAEAENPRWQSSWRKPEPGMLLQAMADAGVEPHQTLFVGDSPGDRSAAQASGCRYAPAVEFFSRHWVECGDLVRALE